MDQDLAKTLNAVLLLGQWQFELVQEALRNVQGKADNKVKPPTYLKLRRPGRKGRVKP